MPIGMANMSYGIIITQQAAVGVVGPLEPIDKGDSNNGADPANR